MKRITIIIVTFVAGLILLAEVFSGVKTPDAKRTADPQNTSYTSGFSGSTYPADTILQQPE